MGVGNGTGKHHSPGGPGDQYPGVMGHSKVSIMGGMVAMACACSFIYVLSFVLMSAHSCWTNPCAATPCTEAVILRPAAGSNISLAASNMGNVVEDSMPPAGTVEHPRGVQAERDSSLRAADGPSGARRTATTDASRIVFGIAAARDMWWGRKEYLKLWWRPSQMRGFVFLDNQPYGNYWPPEWPPYRISENTSHFKYTYKGGWRSAIRISRIVSELTLLDLPNVDWFVMGDDDTLFFVDNLVQVLSKYDHTKMYYIGSNSESHLQNILFSYSMAFGGGGFAISSPLAQALAKMQDGCLSRYPYLFGSDDRMHACMAELGVPLTKEPGFHQLDIIGDISGLLAAHPVAPLVTLHHLDIINPIFPNTATKNYTRVRALKHLLNAAEVEMGSIVQQSICYAQNLKWSFSVSWGYVIQVHRGFVSPRDLEIPQKTFKSWHKERSKVEFPFNTRDHPEDVCKQPTRFFMDSVGAPNADSDGAMSGIFIREFNEEKRECAEKLQPLSAVQRIHVMREKIDESWYQTPRRSCCRIRNWKNDDIDIHVGPCEEDESLLGSF